jgi:LacI family transcriptional regulator
MGYDDQDLARYTHPPLSTVLLPNYEMGRWAAETLIAEVRSGSGNIATLQSECPLVSRDSVGPPTC